MFNGTFLLDPETAVKEKIIHRVASNAVGAFSGDRR